MAPNAGQKVKVHYRGTLADGTEFDCSEGREPLEFTVGSGEVIGGFDAAVSGMEVGEKTTVTIPAEAAYGPRDNESIHHVPAAEIGGDAGLEVGMGVQAQTGEGHTMLGVVTAISDIEVTIDFNHPLAGEALTFELELVEIVEE